MSVFLKALAFSLTLSLLLLGSLYVHPVNELALAQGLERSPQPIYSLTFPEGEQVSAIGLPPGGPSARSGHTAIKDVPNNEMVIFGGCYFDYHGGYVYHYNDVWKLDLDSYNWTQISTSGPSPPPIRDHISVYDPVDHRMLVFGGSTEGGLSNDVYELDLSSYTWDLLSPAGGAPAPRWDHCGVYNGQDHTMAVFGGRDLEVAFNDLWILDLHTLVWQSVYSSGPSTRMAASAIYVPVTNNMLVFGGSNYWVDPWPYTQYNDLWEFSFDTQSWTELFPDGTLPSQRANHLASYDSVENRMLIFGGMRYYDVMLNDLWELDLNTFTWSRLFPTLARSRHAGVLDESKGELIFFGGDFHGHYYYFDDGFRIFATGSSPAFGNGDVNCDGERDVSDVIYLINYLFLDGAEPCTIR